MNESTKGALRSSHLNVGVVKDDGGSFAAQLHEARLQRLAGGGGNDRANGRATSEIDLLDHGRVDQLGGNGRGVVASGVQDIQDAIRQACLGEDAADVVVAARAELGALEDRGISGSNGVENGTDTENVWGVPAEHRFSLNSSRCAAMLLPGRKMLRTMAQCPEPHQRAP